MEPPIDYTPTENSSIAAVVARLARWGRLAPHGLARVEFVSEFSRLHVVSDLRTLYADKGIPFDEIELPLETPAEQIVTDLKRKFQSLEPGVVSLSGFETAFPPDIPLFDSLRLLNFNRENLADHPLRQIWWMTPRFAQEVVQSIPDLDSWFIVKMRLEQLLLISDGDNKIVEPEYPRPDVALAIQISERAKDRFVKALAMHESPRQLLSLSLDALSPLLEADCIDESIKLRNELFEMMFQARVDMDRFLYHESIDLPIHAANIDLINRFASICRHQKDYALSERLYHRVLQSTEAVYGLEHPSTTFCQNNLAILYSVSGRYAEAENFYLQALGVQRRVLGEDDQFTLRTLSNLANLYQRQLLLGKAELLYQQTLARRIEKLGKRHPSTVSTLENYIKVLCLLGRRREADVLRKHYNEPEFI